MLRWQDCLSKFAVQPFPLPKAHTSLCLSGGARIIPIRIIIHLKISHLKDRSLLHLSGGERRKVELATCLAQKSPHLLLDEPLNHLDCVYQQFLLNLLEQQRKEQAVVMVCHDVNAIKTHCSHVLLLLAKDCYLAGESATILNDNNLHRLFDD